jgi:hypothetical protein
MYCVQNYDPAAPVRKKSTAASKVRGGGSAARPASTAADTETDMAAHVRNNTVGKLTVDVLKAWLKQHGLPVSKKNKAQLIEDILAQF